MKNTVCFFCDIRGTFKGLENNNAENYIAFTENLIKLQQENNADSIIFSFVSTDKQDYVASCINTFKIFTNNSITFGKQFFENGYFLNNETYPTKIGKASQIYGYLEQLNEEVNINKVYFADDSEMNLKILNFLNSAHEDKYDIVTINPTENEGLKELNNLLGQTLKTQRSSAK